MQRKPGGKLELTWGELADILERAKLIPHQRVDGITLMKPKIVRITYGSTRNVMS